MVGLSRPHCAGIAIHGTQRVDGLCARKPPSCRGTGQRRCRAGLAVLLIRQKTESTAHPGRFRSKCAKRKRLMRRLEGRVYGRKTLHQGWVPPMPPLIWRSTSSLTVRGRVIPSSLQAGITLEAETESGRLLEGESAVGQAGERIAALRLTPDGDAANPALMRFARRTRALSVQGASTPASCRTSSSGVWRKSHLASHPLYSRAWPRVKNPGSCPRPGKKGLSRQPQAEY